MLNDNSANGLKDKFSVSKSYSLNESDASLIEAIGSLLKKKAYNGLFTVDSHLVMLDSIKGKLSLINVSERQNGVINWEVRQRISEIGELMTGLKRVRQRLFSSLQ